MANFPYPENMTSIFDLFTHVNTLTNGFLGAGILIVVFAVALISSKSGSIDKSFAFAGFLTFITAVLLRFLNFISNGLLYGVIVAMIGIVVYLWYQREKESP